MGEILLNGLFYLKLKKGEKMSTENEATDTSTEVENQVDDSETSTTESEVAEETTETTENSDNSEEETSSESSEDEGETKTEESDTSGEEALSSNKAKKRIGKLTAKNFALEGEIERLRAAQVKPTGPTIEPKEEDYEDYAEFEKASFNWKYDQRRQADADEDSRQSSVNQAKERQNAFNKRADKYMETKDDYIDVAESPELIALYANEARHVAEIIESHDLGPEIAYYLGENPDKVIELAQMSDRLAAVKIGEIGIKLSATPKPKAVSKAGKPISPIGGGGSDPAGSDKDDPHGDNLSINEWNAREDAKERAQK